MNIIKQMAALLLVIVELAACGDNKAAEHQENHANEAKQPPGVVILDTAALRLGGIETGKADTYSASSLPVTGSITYDANRVSHIGARATGRVVSMRADVGERVNQGAVLALLESPEVGEIRTQETEAAALVKIAQENYSREKRLADQGISSRKELLQAEAELRRAEAALNSAEERLRVLGAGHGQGGQFAILAPFSGVVVARDASMGEMANPETNLFTVADLSRVWIEFDVFERDLSRVERGQSVSVSVAAYPGRNFPGKLVYLNEILDETRRTLRARVDLPNESGSLKPGMFATGSIQVASDGSRLALVPIDAVQDIDKRRVVFVPGSKPGQFRAVTVETGDIVNGTHIVIRTGLSPLDVVVTKGAFTLRAELQKEELAEGEH